MTSRSQGGFLLFAAAAALAWGAVAAISQGLYEDAFERGEREMDDARRALLNTAGLEPVHHEVFRTVGPARWEREVKPGFMSAITFRTIGDTGDPFPSWTDVIAWSREHPEEARELLRRYADPPE